MTYLDKLRELQENWQAPQQLERARPRPVRWTVKGYLSLLLASGLLAGGLALGLHIYTVATWPAESESLTQGRHRSDAPPWVAPLLVLPFWFSGIMIIREALIERRLLEYGRAAPGIVTRLGIPTDKGRRVYYEFLTMGGGRAEGKYGPVHKSKQLQPGSALTVIYDPDNPRRNRRYPLNMVRTSE